MYLANEPGGYLNQLDVADTLPAGVDEQKMLLQYMIPYHPM